MAVVNVYTLSIRRWLKRHWIWSIAPTLLLALVWSGYEIKKENNMPPPLVFLIPSNYFGPVFFLFGQIDGVDVQPDPLGQAVTIPANGILKVKAPVEKVMGRSKEGYRATYMIAAAPNGNRQILKVFAGSQRNEDGSFSDTYFDENTKVKQYPSAVSAGKQPFYYLSEKEKNELMVFGHGGCAHQEFTPKDDPNAKSPACGKFLVLTPNQYLKKPDFLWEEFAHRFSSIDALVKQANEALAEKKAFYKLS